MHLEGRTVVLGVTGSIAAVRCVDLVHELRRAGATVRAVMTDAAQDIIGPQALAAATGNAVVTELTGRMEHVELCGGTGDPFADDPAADLVLIAPASANTVGKLAQGLADTPVTATATAARGNDIPLVVAPAMHAPMYDDPAVQENLETLTTWGVEVVPPRREEGKAKIAAVETISRACERAVGDTPLAGEHVVITSGATQEAVDPVRVLTTRASGRMGRALAAEAYARGAEVAVIHRGDEPIPYAATRTVESAADMIDAAQAAADNGCDIFLSAAAISDYTVDVADEKIRSGQDLTLSLEQVPTLIDTLRGTAPDAVIAGFKLESGGDRDDRIRRARELADDADLDIVVANDVSAMGAATAAIDIVNGDAVQPAEGTKEELASAIMDAVQQEIG